MKWSHCIAWTLCLTGGTSLSFAAEWTQFRGPNNSGVIETGKLPTEWSSELNVAWKAAVPGAAWSSPIVLGDKVFVTTAITDNQVKPKAGGFGPGGGRGFGPPGGPPRPDADGKGKTKGDDKGPPGGRGPGRGGFGPGGFGGFGGPGPKPPDAMYRFEVHCLDLKTGDTLWKQVANERKPAIATHATNTYASETPVTDGEHLYVYFGMHGLTCFDLEGNIVWKKDLGSYPMQMGWGTGSSPTLEGDRLFLQIDNEKQSFLVALDKRTGEQIWRVDRDSKSTWSTPFIWRSKDRTELIACGGNRILSYDVADGKVLWHLDDVAGGFNATPVADEERLYVGVGGMGPFGNSPLFAIRAGASGDISLKDKETSNDAIVWSRLRAGPSMASPLVYQGYLYILEQRGGMLSCYDAKTGEPAYARKRIPEATGYYSSPWANDGKIFCLDQEGQTTVIKAGPEFTILAQNKIGEMCWSSPAFAEGTLLLRGVDHLYCIK